MISTSNIHKICGFQAVKTLTAEGDLASQIMRAAAVAFGGGRKGDYPKAWPGCGSPVHGPIFRAWWMMNVAEVKQYQWFGGCSVG